MVVTGDLVGKRLREAGAGSSNLLTPTSQKINKGSSPERGAFFILGLVGCDGIEIKVHGNAGRISGRRRRPQGEAQDAPSQIFSPRPGIRKKGRPYSKRDAVCGEFLLRPVIWCELQVLSCRY